MNCKALHRICCVVFLVGLLATGLATSPAAAALSASLSLEPSPWVSVGPGGAATFHVMLDYVSSDGYPLFSFKLDISDSDPALPFDAFSFALDGGMTGKVSGGFNDEFSDEGSVEFMAWGLDSGIPVGNDIELGIISLDAPTALGLYDVALFVNPNPFLVMDGTNLLVDDGSLWGLTLPGNGDLSVTNSGVNVIPEPSSIALWGIGLATVLVCHYRFRKRRPQAAV